MKAGRLLRRLRAIFRRKNKGNGTKSGAKHAVRSRSARHIKCDPVIIHHRIGQEGMTVDQDGNVVEQGVSISLNEMLSTTNSQPLSPFFAMLPLEIRRIIYREVWQAYLKPRRVSPAAPGSDLRLHLYKDSSTGTNLTHTRCKLHPGEPVAEDTFVTAPWPFDTHGHSPPATPPRWYWEAWVMRLNWGRHWKCQHAVQKRWDPRAGRGRMVERAPFLPLFLACKRMYAETMPSFLENVTLIFTSSLDAHHFFLQQPQPRAFLAHLRCLELSLTNINDHLYLTRIRHDDPPQPPATADSNEDAVTPNTDNTNNNPNSFPAPADSADPAPGSCLNIFCQVDLFGAELWRALVRGIRAAAPELRDLDVTVAGRVEHLGILERFGRVEESPEDEDPNWGVFSAGRGDRQRAGTGGYGEVEEGGDDEVWELSGKVAVAFRIENRCYVQRGRKMVRVMEQVAE